MTDDKYNPDSFDWGESTQGLSLSDVGDDVYETLVQAALNAQEETYGWRHLRRSERKEGAGRLFRARNVMPKEGREWAEEEFPGYTFVWDGALGHHDHPVSNLCTELNEIEMVSDLVESGEGYIDLFGNGKRDARYKRKCINMYTLATPKDYLRYQKLGARDVPFDMEKLCDKNHALGKINRITVTHALYYLSMGQIGRIVNVSKQRKLSALVHRHNDTHGFLNHGEQEYWVSEAGMVTQVNVATGEKYTHPSLEALFHQGSAKTESGGVAWTIRKSGGDAYIIDFVGCPNEICETYVPLQFLKPETAETFEYSSIKVRKFLNWTWMTASTSTGQVPIEDMELFGKLRRYVAGKQRTPRLKVEVMNHARRMCNKDDIISIHGGGASGIPVGSMAAYAEVAFYIDARTELDAAISFHKENAAVVTALNAYYDSGKTPKDFTLVTQAAVISTKAFSDAAVKIIDGIRKDSTFTTDEYLSRGLPMGENRDLLVTDIDYQEIPGPWW